MAITTCFLTTVVYILASSSTCIRGCTPTWVRVLTFGCSPVWIPGDKCYTNTYWPWWNSDGTTGMSGFQVSRVLGLLRVSLELVFGSPVGRREHFLAKQVSFFCRHPRGAPITRHATRGPIQRLQLPQCPHTFLPHLLNESAPLHILAVSTTAAPHDTKVS